MVTNDFMEAKDKPIYSIGEASKMLGVVVPFLRLLETTQLLLTSRNEHGKRLYSQCDIEYIRAIIETAKKCRFDIEEIQHNIAGVKCWETLNCPEDKKLQCPHYISPSIQCWSDKTRLCREKAENCRLCEVYKSLTDYLIPQETI
jgi:hypothetical protein